MTDPIEEDIRDHTGRVMAVTALIVFVGCGVAVAAFYATTRYVHAQHLGLPWQIGVAVAYCVVIFAVCVFAARVARKTVGPGYPCTPAMKRYQRRAMAAGVVYMGALLAAAFTYKAMHPTGVLAWIIGVAPSVPVVGMILALGVYLREETDEFQRAIQTEAALWATGGLLTLATVWGFLEMFGLVIHVEVWAAFPIWAVLLGPGQLIARGRYR
jgi:hypothetical protein